MSFLYRRWPDATNLVLNGGFETNVTEWDDYGSADFPTRVTSQFKFGVAACQVNPTAQNGGMRSPAIAATSAQVYTFSVWVLDVVGKSYQLSAIRADLATAIGSVTWTGTGAWARRSVTVTAPATENIYMRLRDRSVAVANFFVDGAQVETGSIATPYIETDGGTASRTAGPVIASVGGPFMIPRAQYS